MPTFAIDRSGWFRELDAAPGQRADLPPGWRLATRAEIDLEEQLRAHRTRHGAGAHLEPDPAPEIVLAGEIGARLPFALTRADLVALNVAAVGRHEPQVRDGHVQPLAYPGAAPNRPVIDVEVEIAAMLTQVAELLQAGHVLAAAALIGWRASWIHPFPDGNGRSSRAAAYAVLLAGAPELRAAHAARLGAVGRERLTVPERIERSTATRYTPLMNIAHAAAVRPDGYARTVDLASLEHYLGELAADQLGARPSVEDPSPCLCGGRERVIRAFLAALQ